MKNEYSKNQMLLAMEYGYKQCEKGNNFQMAKANFLLDLENK